MLGLPRAITGPYSYGGAAMRDELKAEAYENRQAFIKYITHQSNHKKKHR